MIETSKRMLDLWFPPDDAGKPLGCLATTFTFEPDFFEQQCLGRYLGLDTRPGEGADLAFLIEREEKLAEVQVCVIADRRLNPDGRSLRWDVITVAAPRGVMHAKIVLLVWERAVRFIVSSANLCAQAYRQSIELAISLDASPGAEVSRTVFRELLDAIARIVRLAPPARESRGPRPRAQEIIDRADAQVAAFNLPERPPRGSPRLAVVVPGFGHDAFDGLMSTWAGPRPRWATVMSPYFDTKASANGPSRRLADLMSPRSKAIEFVVPVEYLGDQQIAQAPGALLDGLPDQVTGIFDIEQPDRSEPRKLHGKLILIESHRWISALVGSSNFTSAGLGLGGGGNVEVGIAVGAAQGTDTADVLAELALRGEEVFLEDDGVALEDPQEREVPVPAGFVQVLGDPGPPACLEFELDPPQLPAEWSISTPDGHRLTDRDMWEHAGRLSLFDLPTPNGELPFNIAIRWRARDGETRVGSLPVNVTDPAGLPPPAELRELPVDLLIRALASLRPLHEAADAEARRRRRRERKTEKPLSELDPLRRFSPSGQLLYRTQELSGALAGLQQRLERPAASLDAFLWRVTGPFGPVQIAEKLIAERRANRSIPGEEAFMLAEIGLTLAAIDVEKASRLIPERKRRMRRVLRDAVNALENMCGELDPASPLTAYVRGAFSRARR
jgi:hypothetical protein